MAQGKLKHLHNIRRPFGRWEWRLQSPECTSKVLTNSSRRRGYFLSFSTIVTEAFRVIIEWKKKQILRYFGVRKKKRKKYPSRLGIFLKATEHRDLHNDNSMKRRGDTWILKRSQERALFVGTSWTYCPIQGYSFLAKYPWWIMII